MASDKVGVKCALRTAALGHFVPDFHRLPDNCGLYEYSKTVLDSVNRLGIRKDRRDLMEPHVEHPRGGDRVQNCPLLSGEGEYWKLLSVRSDVAAERVFTTNVRSVFDAVNAGTGHEEGSNRDAPNCVPPGSASIFRCLKGVPEKSGRGQPDLVETRHREIEGRSAAPKGQANRDDAGEWLAGVANRDKEGAHSPVFSFDDKTSHHDGDFVDTECRVGGGHESRWRSP